MPATPLPDKHVEQMEALDDRVVRLAVATADVLEALGAGKLTAMDIAQGARMLRQLANTYRVTPKVARTQREVEEDRRRLRRLTPTGTDLDSLRGGKVIDPEAA